MSKKDLIRKYKNGQYWERVNGNLMCYDVRKYLKRYLAKNTCKMTSQEKEKLKDEAEEALKINENN